jgi:hypothetical protein
MRGVTHDKIAEGFLFSDVLLFADRYFFAAMTYQHHASAADRCLNIVALLDGEAPFIWAMP